MEDPFYSPPRRFTTGRYLLHRIGRYRRGRTGFVLLSILILSCFYFVSTISIVDITNRALIPLRFPSSFEPGRFAASFHLSDNVEPVAEQHTSLAKPSRLHLLVPATTSNENLCKTILSALILNYPPPTLINFNKTFEDEGWDNGTHTGKIRGVLDFLSDAEQVQDDDIVLVIDGYDIWFQLPSQVMLSRFRKLVKDSNVKLRQRYGSTFQSRSHNGFGKNDNRYELSVLFAADKICWPNSYTDPACSSVPESTLPADAWGPATDQDPAAFLNRPKYLNSGTVIGKAADLRMVYKQAVQKVEVEEKGQLGDQFVFAEIFGEQEYMREADRQSRLSAGARWREWVSEQLGLQSRNPLNTSIFPANVNTFCEEFEFGIGLDYEAQLFQTLTHSHGDLEFLKYSNTTKLVEAQDLHRVNLRSEVQLSEDLQNIPGPFHLKSPVNNTITPLSSDLDHLPATDSSWADIGLASNLHVPSIPSLFHFNGDKEYLTSWWPSMWFQPWGRALLRRYIRTPPASDILDSRGGKGGVWASDNTFLQWSDLCGGYEDAIFADGKGLWGKEEGGIKIYNAFGKLIAGEEDEELEE
jgi:hypothetical protein